MKRAAIAALLLISCVSAVGAREAAPAFIAKWYGSFREIIHKKNLHGVVTLDQALSGPHLYAVGMIQNAAGEITVVDGKVSLNYGKDGIGNAVTKIRKGEEASILITANVRKWRTVPIPENMTEAELHGFVLEEARKTGINTREPFPFLIDGTIKKLVWSVIDGTDPELTRQTHQLFFRKLVGYRAEAQAVLIGFSPAELQGELAWPGERWHVHVLFKGERTTGHVNAFSVEKGAVLQLPVREQVPLPGSERASLTSHRTMTLQ
jgi:alpha-acetolactate decarboxylase